MKYLVVIFLLVFSCAGASKSTGNIIEQGEVGAPKKEEKVVRQEGLTLDDNALKMWGQVHKDKGKLFCSAYNNFAGAVTITKFFYIVQVGDHYIVRIGKCSKGCMVGPGMPILMFGPPDEHPDSKIVCGAEVEPV